MFCPSFDLLYSTLPQEVKGYPEGILVGVVFFCLAVYARLLREFDVVGFMCVKLTEKRDQKRESECLGVGADPMPD